MGKNRALSDFEQGQLIMARKLGHSISKTTGLVGCYQYAVFTTKSGPVCTS